MKHDIQDTDWGQQLNDWEQAPTPSPAAWDTPPDALWPRIEQDLPPRKRRRPFLFWLLGAGLLGLSAWLYLGNSEMPAAQLATGNRQSAKSEWAMGNSELASGNGQLAKSEVRKSIRGIEDARIRGKLNQVGNSKSEAGTEQTDRSLKSSYQTPLRTFAPLAVESLESSIPQILDSSNLQILKFSNPQILDSSNPRLPPTDLLNGRQPIQLSQTGDSPSNHFQTISNGRSPSLPSDFPKWVIGASVLYGVPNTTNARLPGRTFQFEGQTGWGLQVQRQLTPKWHVQTGLSRQTVDYQVDTRFVRLIDFSRETLDGNVRTSTVNLTTALKADADDAAPVELERPANSGNNIPNRVILVTQDALHIRKTSVPLQVGYRVWQRYPLRLDAQAGLQWTSYRAEIVRENIRVQHSFFQLRSADVPRRPPLAITGSYLQWSAGLTTSVHLQPNWQLALQVQALSGRTEVLERLSVFTPQVDLGVRYRF